MGYPRALNDSGQVLSESGSLWRNGVVTQLTFPGTDQVGAAAINAHGSVAGVALGRPVVWQADGTAVDLGPLVAAHGGTRGEAVDINDQGQVLGSYVREDGSQFGFVWQDSNHNGVAEGGEFLTLSSPDGQGLLVRDINNRGQVTGVMVAEGNTGERGFVWENGVMTSLASFGYQHSSGLSINERGQVLGRAYTVEWGWGGSYQVVGPSFLATPVNTPAGSNVTVEPAGGVSLSFSSVVSAGNTTVSPIATPEPPIPNVVGALYFDISTTATFTGKVTVSARYDPTRFAVEQNVSLWHFENGAWVDITTGVDTANHVVHGETTSFSPFAVGQRPYSWSGVLQPVNADGSSVFKLGSTVPVKFQLTGASAGITGLAARLYLAQLSGDIAGSEQEAVSTSAADSGNTFRYTGGQYLFNLGTRTLAQGTYLLRIDLGDGMVATRENGRLVVISLRN